MVSPSTYISSKICAKALSGKPRGLFRPVGGAKQSPLVKGALRNRASNGPSCPQGALAENRQEEEASAYAEPGDPASQPGHDFRDPESRTTTWPVHCQT